MTRNYSKRTRRYAMGGIVPQEKEERDDTEYEAKKYNYMQQRDLELPQNVVPDTEPEWRKFRDLHPKDYRETEDI